LINLNEKYPTIIPLDSHEKGGEELPFCSGIIFPVFLGELM
jgi:hypothetical protein